MPQAGKYYDANNFKKRFTGLNLSKLSYNDLINKIRIYHGVIINNQFITKINKTNKGLQLKDCQIKRISGIPSFIYNYISKCRK